MNKAIIESLEGRTMYSVSPTLPPNVQYHLTAHPFEALNTSATDYLDAAEKLVRALSVDQNSSGQIIDRYTHQQEATTTAYYANVIGNLISVGRALDLLPSGIAAMESATKQLVPGNRTPEEVSGNNFLDPLTEGLTDYAPYVSAATLSTWRTRMTVPIEKILDTNTNNHRTYAMKGEWARSLAGLVTHDQAVKFVEANWKGSQRARIINDVLGLYHDQSSDPDSMNVETNARANLVWLLAKGYDGPSHVEMEQLLTKGTKNLLYLEDPTGQAPNGGRTSNNVWGDTISGVAFELMASYTAQTGDITTAGQLRHAANLAFDSVQKFTNADGTQAIMKDQFDPSLKIGWADFTYFSSTTAAQAYRFTAIYNQRLAEDALYGPITEVPVASEIGGYALQTDKAFATIFADAGGMQLEASLVGSSSLNHGRYWSTLGITRFSRPDWDSRLGPGDGERNEKTKLGVSFSPTFLSGSTWNRLASMPDKYTGTFSVQFTSPVLVRASIDYKPKQSSYGPTFHQDLVITPDGVLSTLTSSAKAGTFGINWPVLTSDGKTALVNTFTSQIATVRFPDGTDEQNYIAINSNPTIATSEATVRGANGDIRPVRMVTTNSSNQTFVYPRTASDPTAQAVQSTFVQTSNGFASALGRVSGDVYVGRTSAGGVGSSVDFDADGTADMTFSTSVGFVMQRATDGTITNIEADRPVTMSMNGQQFVLGAYTPVAVNLTAPPMPQVISPTPSPSPTPTPSPSPTPTPSPSPTPTPSPSPSPTPTPSPSPTPTPSPTPSPTPTTIRKEFESLTPSAQSDSTSIRPDPVASGGNFVRLEANASGDYVTYKLSGLSAGTFSVILSARLSDNYGIVQASVATSSSGTYTNVGTTHDMYSSSANYTDINLGSITVSADNSTRYFRFKVTGKSSASSAYKFGLDAITLLPV